MFKTFKKISAFVAMLAVCFSAFADGWNTYPSQTTIGPNDTLMWGGVANNYLTTYTALLNRLNNDLTFPASTSTNLYPCVVVKHYDGTFTNYYATNDLQRGVSLSSAYSQATNYDDIKLGPGFFNYSSTLTPVATTGLTIEGEGNSVTTLGGPLVVCTNQFSIKNLSFGSSANYLNTGPFISNTGNHTVTNIVVSGVDFYSSNVTSCVFLQVNGMYNSFNKVRFFAQTGYGPVAFMRLNGQTAAGSLTMIDTFLIYYDGNNSTSANPIGLYINANTIIQNGFITLKNEYFATSVGIDFVGGTSYLKGTTIFTAPTTGSETAINILSGTVNVDASVSYQGAISGSTTILTHF